MIEISNPERFGAFRVQDYDKAIPVGWLVVAIGTTGTKASMTRCHGPNQNGYLMQGDDEIPTSKAVVLIAQLKDDTIADLHDRTAKNEIKIIKVMKEKEDAVKALVTLSSERDALKRQAEAEAGAHNNTLLSLKTERALRLKLEGDIAKIRRHFGEKAMREALEKP